MKSFKKLFFFLNVLIFFLGGGWAQSLDQNQLPYKIILFCLDASPQADQSVVVGIKIEIPPHWKLSSEVKKASQFGLPLSFEWKLSREVRIEKIGGTTPINLNENNQEQSVYKGNSFHFFKLSAPDKESFNSPIPIKVGIKGLFCHDRCLPFNETHEIVLQFPRQLSLLESEIKNAWEDSLQPAETITQSDTPREKDVSIIILVILGIVGGIILNGMPCVFPILSLKIMHLMYYTTKKKRVLHTWGYTLGGIGTFLSLGGAIMLLQAIGHNVGWGFQMQSPIFILSLMVIFFSLALNLSGVFEFPGLSFSLQEEHTDQDDDKKSLSYFFQSMGTGVISTLAATPCTAPFMVTSLGYALTATPLEVCIIMISLGLGFVLPFFVLSYTPRLLGLLPKPGVWMVTFKEVMAFPLYGTVLWLCWVLSHQIGKNAIFYGGGTIFLAAFCIWFYQKMTPFHTKWARFFTLLCAFIVMTLPFIGVLYDEKPQKPARYSKEVFTKLLSEKKPVFVYATASWCVTCHINERILDQKAIQTEFKNHQITVLKADYTNHDKEISLFLKDHGHVGVPFYVFYDAFGKKHIFPQILTKASLLNVLRTEK